ncbi:MAG: hypothetical protein AB7M12_13480 [Hyphomonadaceae bacterium]
MAEERVLGEVWTITGDTPVYRGYPSQPFVVANLEPFGGQDGVITYDLTHAGSAPTTIAVPAGSAVRHNVTTLTLGVAPGGKPWRAVVTSLLNR